MLAIAYVVLLKRKFIAFLDWSFCYCRFTAEIVEIPKKKLKPNETISLTKKPLSKTWFFIVALSQTYVFWF